MMVAFWHLLPLVVSALLTYMYCLGHNHGVRETEQRWSDAVGRRQAYLRDLEEFRTP